MDVRKKRRLRRKKHRRLRRKIKRRAIKAKLTKKLRTQKENSKMCSIAQYFKLDKTIYPDSGLEFYIFDNSQLDNFVKDSLVPFREAYIEESKLMRIVSEFGTKREDEIAERLPDKGDVMSGDFGEILAFYLACQIWSPSANVLPMKWRFKDKKKAPSHYTDIVLFELGDMKNPSNSDKMFTYEVKTRATALTNAKYKQHVKKSYITYKDGKQECTILEAVCDASKDAVERAAETIPYLKTRCKDLGLKELYYQIDRFSNGYKVSYQKEHHAVAIVDSTTLDQQMARMPADLLTSHPSVKSVFCLPIDNLKAVYERIFTEMPTKA